LHNYVADESLLLGHDASMGDLTPMFRSNVVASF